MGQKMANGDGLAFWTGKGWEVSFDGSIEGNFVALDEQQDGGGGGDDFRERGGVVNRIERGFLFGRKEGAMAESAGVRGAPALDPEDAAGEAIAGDVGGDDLLHLGELFGEEESVDGGV